MATVSQSIKARKPAKVRKPHPDFPLTPHPTGRWCKKVRGRLVYFGKIADDPKGEAALTAWNAEKDHVLLTGRRPETTADNRVLTLAELINLFLNAKRQRVNEGGLAEATWRDYHGVGEQLVEAFGRTRPVSDLRPLDFERLRAIIAKGKRGGGVGPVAISNFIIRAKTIFHYAANNGLIDRPLLFGDGFKVPPKVQFREARNIRGPRMFTAVELRRIIAKADQPLRAMILLGINAGLGNADCGKLTQDKIDLGKAWLSYPRPKTQVARRAPLWPETVKALREWAKLRPDHKDEAHASLVFVTRCGAPWFKNGTPDNPVSKEFRKLLDEIGIMRKGLNFYGLRHTFETVAGETLDQPAIDRIMGHAENAGDMSAVYREAVDDARLAKVVNHVRKWLKKKLTSRKPKPR
jgi:integrase